MNRNKVLIWLIAIAILAIAVPRLFKQEAPEITLPRLEIRSDAVLTGLIYKRIKRNDTIVELFADQATLIKKEQILETKNPKLLLHPSGAQASTTVDGSHSKMRYIKVTARRGRLNIETMETVFFDDVVLKTPDQGTLYTDVLKYVPKTHTLKSDVPVIIKKGGLEIKGSSLVYDTHSGRLLIRGSSTNINGI